MRRAVSLCCCVMGVASAYGQGQQKLVASDAADSDFFGSSVSISGDVAVIGSPLDNPRGQDSGSMYVFTKTGGVWTQQARVNASDGGTGDYFGTSVAVSGGTAIAGAWGFDQGAVENTGAAYIFTRSGSSWVQTAKLTASDAAAFDWFGVSVAIDEAAGLAAVGATGREEGGPDNGAVYIFTRQISGLWTQTAKVEAASPPARDQEFGASVALRGGTLVVGAPERDLPTFSGSVFVFTLSGGVWTQQARLTASDAAARDGLGASVALSTAGDTLIAGAMHHDAGAGQWSGAAYVFANTGGVWAQQAKLVPSDTKPWALAGWGVGIGQDAAVVGAPYMDDAGFASGAAYTFTRAGGVWTQAAKLTADDAAATDSLGACAAVSADDAEVLVGAYGDDDGSTPDRGAAYAFTDIAGIACSADMDGDGVVNFVDYLAFLSLFDSLDPAADLDADGVVDFVDYLEFLNRYDECAV